MPKHAHAAIGVGRVEVARLVDILGLDGPFHSDPSTDWEKEWEERRAIELAERVAMMEEMAQRAFGHFPAAILSQITRFGQASRGLAFLTPKTLLALRLGKIPELLEDIGVEPQPFDDALQWLSQHQGVARDALRACALAPWGELAPLEGLALLASALPQEVRAQDWEWPLGKFIEEPNNVSSEQIAESAPLLMMLHRRAERAPGPLRGCGIIQICCEWALFARNARENPALPPSLTRGKPQDARAQAEAFGDYCAPFRLDFLTRAAPWSEDLAAAMGPGAAETDARDFCSPRAHHGLVDPIDSDKLKAPLREALARRLASLGVARELMSCAMIHSIRRLDRAPTPDSCEAILRIIQIEGVGARDSSHQTALRSALETLTDLKDSYRPQTFVEEKGSFLIDLVMRLFEIGFSLTEHQSREKGMGLIPFDEAVERRARRELQASLHPPLQSRYLSALEREELRALNAPAPTPQETEADEQRWRLAVERLRQTRLDPAALLHHLGLDHNLPPRPGPPKSEPDRATPRL